MYILLELQTTNGITSVITTTHTSRDEAEQKYHQILSYAAVSSVEFHAASMLDPLGSLIKNECYNHPVQPEPNEETEGT